MEDNLVKDVEISKQETGNESFDELERILFDNPGLGLDADHELAAPWTEASIPFLSDFEIFSGNIFDGDAFDGNVFDVRAFDGSAFDGNVFGVDPVMPSPLLRFAHL